MAATNKQNKLNTLGVGFLTEDKPTNKNVNIAEETKSVSKHLLIKGSIDRRIKELANINGVSYNKVVSYILETYFMDE